MLGWFGLDEMEPGEADRILAQLIAELQADGLRVAGAIQMNTDTGADCACDMDLIVLGDDAGPIRISQSLGPHSTGCRLDPEALEHVAMRVGRHLEGADILVLPKFGRQEAAGRGFRQVISATVAAGMPVVLHVPRDCRDAFDRFTDGMAERIDPDAIRQWCLQLTDRGATG